MTRTLQSRFVLGGIIYTALTLCLFGLAVYSLLPLNLEKMTVSLPGPQPRPQALPVTALPGIFALLVFSLASLAGTRNLLQKTAAPELFFLMLFFLSLTAEHLRAGILLLQLRAFPARFAVTLTRAVYMGRLFGLLCLLVSSLYAVGFKYSHYSTLIGFLVLLAFTLASILPIDSTRLEPDLLYRLGDPKVYLFVNYVLGFLMLLSFLVARQTRGSRRFLTVALAALLVFLGKELLSRSLSPWSAAGGVLCLVGGTVLFSRQIGVVYLRV